MSNCTYLSTFLASGGFGSGFLTVAARLASPAKLGVLLDVATTPTLLVARGNVADDDDDSDDDIAVKKKIT